MRVTWSVEPPAAHGTMIVTGFEGFQLCAWTGAAINAANSKSTCFMSLPQCVEKHVCDMPRAPGECARRHKVAVEDARQRIAVAEIEVPLAGDRDVELHRIDALAEHALGLAPAQHIAQQRNQVRVHLVHAA